MLRSWWQSQFNHLRSSVPFSGVFCHHSDANHSWETCCSGSLRFSFGSSSTRKPNLFLSETFKNEERRRRRRRRRRRKNKPFSTWRTLWTRLEKNLFSLSIRFLMLLCVCLTFLSAFCFKRRHFSVDDYRKTPWPKRHTHTHTHFFINLFKKLTKRALETCQYKFKK